MTCYYAAKVTIYSCRIYRAKGLPRQDAERIADQIMTNRKVALDTLTREELGAQETFMADYVPSCVNRLNALGSGTAPARAMLKPCLSQRSHGFGMQ